jgi:hypothetical protein
LNISTKYQNDNHINVATMQISKTKHRVEKITWEQSVRSNRDNNSIRVCLLLT